MALFSTLRDDFSGVSIDGTKWTQSNTSGSTASQGSGVLTLTPANVASSRASIYSTNFFDLTNSAVFVEVPNPPLVQYSTTRLLLMPNVNTSSNYLSIEVTNGSISYISSWNGNYTASTTDYDSYAQRWWRIRNSGSNIIFEISPDGNSWTATSSIPSPGTITSMQVYLFSGQLQTLSHGSIISTFDNLNFSNSQRIATGKATGGGAGSYVSESATITVSDSASGGGKAAELTYYQSIQQKDYEYRVYDHAHNFIGIWQDVKSDFSYQQSINQAPSELTVQIARAPDNLITTYDALLDKSGASVTDQTGNPIYVATKNPNAVGVGTDVEYNYNVDVYTFYGGFDQLLDKNSNPILDSTSDPILVQYGAPNGKLVYSGYIVDYELDYGQQEGVTITIVPNATELNHYLYLSSSNTTVVQNSTDPVAMARSAMDSYITQGGVLGYNASTMVLSGWTSSYTFKLQRIKDVLDKVIELLPVGYYYYVDPGDNFVYLKLKGTTADHTFYYEQHITDMKLKRSISQLINKVYFVGGDMGAGVDLLRYNSDATSITNIRPGLDILSDSRVTLTSSADIISQSKINDYKIPRYRTTITISDAVYDIETIKLGQMVAFGNFGNFVDSLMLQIVTLTRAKHTVTLDLDMVVPNDTKRLEEIKRNLLSEQVDAIPVAPI